MLLAGWSLSRTSRKRPARRRFVISSRLAVALMIAFTTALPHDGQFAPGVWAGLVGRLLLLSSLSAGSPSSALRSCNR